MNFTDYTYFVGSINLPNTAPSLSEGAELVLFIDKYESKYLTDILGYKMAKDFISNMLVVSPPTSGIWFDLLNGKEFTDSNGNLNKWQGFNTIGFNPIANYVYCELLEARETQTTGVGGQKSKINNSVQTSSRQKVVSAWNDMVELNCILYDFLIVNATLYPDFIGLTDVNMDLFRKRNIFCI